MRSVEQPTAPPSDAPKDEPKDPRPGVMERVDWQSVQLAEGAVREAELKRDLVHTLVRGKYQMSPDDTVDTKTLVITRVK